MLFKPFPGTISMNGALHLHSSCINRASSNPTAPMRGLCFVIITFFYIRDVDEKKMDLNLGPAISLNHLDLTESFAQTVSLCAEALWDLHSCARPSD